MIAPQAIRKNQAVAVRVPVDDDQDGYANLNFTATVTGGELSVPLTDSSLDGSFTWQLPAGSYSVTVIATDSGGLSDSSSFSLSVADFNSEPPQPLIAWPSGTPIWFDPYYESLIIPGADSQTPFGSLTYALYDAPPDASLSSDGDFLWNPATGGPVVDPQLHTSYRMLIEIADDGRAGDGVRKRTSCALHY